MMSSPQKPKRVAEDTMNYECIDPDLGQDIWRLDDPVTAPELKQVLLRHCHHCSACASTRAVSQAVDQAVQAGIVGGTPPKRTLRAGRSQWSVGIGGLAMAASIALIVMLPPRDFSREAVTRSSGGSPAILSPVTDEVIASSQPTIRWSPLDRARSYDVAVTTEAGVTIWSTSTASTSVRVPAESALGAPGRYRVMIEPVPSHLVPGRVFGSSFVLGNRRSAAVDRIQRSRVWVRLVGILGLGTAMAGLITMEKSRRRRSAIVSPM